MKSHLMGSWGQWFLQNTQNIRLGFFCGVPAMGMWLVPLCLRGPMGAGCRSASGGVPGGAQAGGTVHVQSLQAVLVAGCQEGTRWGQDGPGPVP